MNSVLLEAGHGQMRPSRLIAEALVLRQDSNQVKARATQLGLPESLIEALVCVCCRDEQEDLLVHIEASR